MVRRVVRAFVWTGVGLLVTAAFGVAVLDTTWFKERLRRYAVERAAPYLNGELAIGRLDGSLFTGVELSNVSLAQAAAETITAETITVRYDPLRLWREGLAFDAVTIRALRVRVAQEADGGWNLARLVRTRAPSGGGASFRIEALTVEDAGVTVDTLATEPRHVSELDFAGRLAYEGGRFSMTVDRLTARDDRSGFVIDALAGSFGDGFRRVDATFSGHAHAARLAGRVAGDAAESGRELHAVLEVEHLDLARLLEQPRFASDISGRADIDATVPAVAGAPTMVAFRFRGPAASAFGYAGEDLTVSGTLGGGRVAFAGGARAYGARLTIDGTWQFSTPSGESTGFSASGTFADANLARLPAHLPIPPFDSRLAGRFNVRTTSGAWNADVTLRRSTLENATLGDGTAGRIDVAGGRIRYRAAGHVERMNVTRLSRPLGVPLIGEKRFDGSLSGSFQAEGASASKRRSLVAHASLADSTLAGTTFPAMDLHLELQDARLLVRAKGAFDGLTGELAGVPEHVPLDLDGTADAVLVVHEIGAPMGPEAIDISGNVELGPSTVRGIAISSASIAGDLTKGVVTLTEASVHGPSLDMTAAGTAALGATGESALHVVVASEDLGPLGDVLGRPLGGAAELTADVTGASSAPRATGTLNARSLGYGTTATALTINTTFEAEMPGRDPAAIAVRARTEGTFVKAGGFDFVRASATTAYARNEVVVDSLLEEASRTLALSGVVGLQAGARAITVRRFEVATADAAWSMPDGREARVEIHDGRLMIDGLVVGRGPQQMSVAGTLPFERPEDGAGLSIRVVDVQLADVNRLLLGTRRLEGVVSGDVIVRGSLKAPDAEATVAIVQGAVEGVPFEDARIKLSYGEGLAEVDAVLTQSAGARLSVVGAVPVRAPATETAAMNLHVASTPIHLGLAQAFTSELSALEGTGTFDVRLTGTTSAPVVDGTVSIDGGAFGVPGTGVEYRDLIARLRFDHNRLEIAQFSVSDDGGQVLRVEGGLDLAGTGAERRFNVTFTADSFSVLDNELGAVRVNAILTASGDFAAPRISADVRIDQGRIEVDRVLEITTKSVYSTTPQEPLEEGAAPPVTPPGVAAATVIDQMAQPVEPATGTLLSRVDLTLHVALPDNLVLRGRDLRTGRSSRGLGDLNIVAGGTLNIRKAPRAPATIVGDLEIVRGYYSFQGRRFEVQPESIVRFRGQTPIDPALDLAADREISGVVASVGVRGSMRDPEVELSSRPPLDDADLLALIVFGQPVNGLGLSQRVSLSERAASMAAGAIATPIADSVARALNVDLFEIQSPAGEAPVVSLGSQIGTRLYLGVRQQIGRGDSSALSIEYRLAEFLRLVTSVVHGAMDAHASERYAQSGADLIFVWRH
jgi:autotransporter translocation and assembly factor TamB